MQLSRESTFLRTHLSPLTEADPGGNQCVQQVSDLD